MTVARVIAGQRDGAHRDTDVGMFMTARTQAQNAADAGATAGALARAYEDFFNDPADSNGSAAENASQAASANLVSATAWAT